MEVKVWSERRSRKTGFLFQVEGWWRRYKIKATSGFTANGGSRWKQSLAIKGSSGWTEDKEGGQQGRLLGMPEITTGWRYALCYELELHPQFASHHFSPAFQGPATEPRIHLHAYSLILCARTLSTSLPQQRAPKLSQQEPHLNGSLISAGVTNNPVGGSMCVSVCTCPHARTRSRRLPSQPLKAPLSYCTLLHCINKYHRQGSLINRAAVSWLMDVWWTLLNNELWWSAVDVYLFSGTF